MTNATTLQQPCARPSGFDRLALAVGLALVSWAQRSSEARSSEARSSEARSSNQLAPTHEELTIRRAAEREAHQLRAEYSAARSHYQTVR